jgi:hypothetical protein
MNPAQRNAGCAISRMPRVVREQVSHCLEDGGDWKDVRKICAEAGHPGVRAQNVTNFRKGAHAEWLRREARIEALRRDSEATAEAVRFYSENGGSPAEAGLLAAAEMLSKAISGMGAESMTQLIADDPKAVLGMMRELARVAEHLGKRNEKAAAATDEAKPQLTPEERTKALKEIFGLPG